MQRALSGKRARYFLITVFVRNSVNLSPSFPHLPLFYKTNRPSSENCAFRQSAIFDYRDVKALCEKFGIEIPAEYEEFVRLEQKNGH